MIQLEIDGFVVNVPVSSHMTAQEFLALADKLALMAGKAHPHEIEQHVATVFKEPREADFKFSDEMRPDQLVEHVKHHMEHLKRHEDRLIQQEEHMKRVLDYLQSLDHFIRKEN